MTIADRIMAAVTELTGVDLPTMMGDSRHERIVRAREIFSAAAHELGNMSYPEIAQYMGRKWHSTAWGADKRFVDKGEMLYIEMRLGVGKTMNERIERMEKMLAQLHEHFYDLEQRLRAQEQGRAA